MIVSAGVWKTGPIHLKSGIELRLEEGAEIRFSTQHEDYLPVVFQQRGGVRCYNYSPFIYAEGCEDVAVTGKGVCEGAKQGVRIVGLPENPITGLTLEGLRIGATKPNSVQHAKGTWHPGLFP